MTYKYFLALAFALLLFGSCNGSEPPFNFNYKNLAYSYNGYDIEPYTTQIYNKPMTEGETGVTLYQTSENSVLTFHLAETILIGYDEAYVVKGFEYYLPQLSLKDGTIINYKDYDHTFFIFKGLKKHNKHLETDKIKFETIDWSGNKKTDHIIFKDKKYILEHSFVQDTIEWNYYNNYSLSISDGDTKQELFKTDRIHEYDVNGGIGVLDFQPYKFLTFLDIDGDGKLDCIFQLEHPVEYEEYFLLFLSSEASGENILKHVATHVIQKNRNSP